MTTEVEKFRERVAKVFRTAFGIDGIYSNDDRGVYASALRIAKDDKGLFVRWSPEHKVTVTYDRLAELAKAFDTTAINIIADPGHEGYESTGGDRAGSTEITVWPNKWPEGDLEAARDDKKR